MSVPNLEHDHRLFAGAPAGSARSGPDHAVVDFRGMFQTLWRRRLSIAAVAAAFVVAAIVIALLIPPQYKATAKLLIDPAGLNVLRNDVTQMPSNADAALAEAESQIGVIRSNDVLFEVVRRAGLEDDPEFGNPQPGGPTSLTGALRSAEGTSDRARTALRRLNQALTVGRHQQTFVIEISVWTKDPQKSARIANTIAEVYLERTRTTRSDLVRRSSDALAARLQDLRERVNDSAERVERYRQENDIVDAGGILVVDQELQEATEELSRVRATLTDLEARYEEISGLRAQALSPEILSEALVSPTITNLRSLLTVALSEASTLEATLGPNHPTLIAAQSNVRQVESQIRAELDRIVEAIRIERDRARARVTALEARLDSLKGDVLGTRSAMLGFRELVRQADSDREIYEAFLKRAGELSEQQSVDTTNAQLISQAAPPLKKGWPPRTMIVLAAGMLGAAFGVGQALLREQFNPRIHSADQVMQEIGVPVLAEVPLAALDANSVAQRGGENALDRFYNQFVSLPGASARWIAIASTESEHLTTKATILLAESAIDAGDRVVLVDADTEHAELSRLFSKADAPGLRELVYQGDNVSTVHTVSNGGRLQLIPVGRDDTAAGSMTTMRSLRKMLDDRNQAANLIVVNTGTLWSSRLHRAVARAADHVVLVAVCSQTRSADLAQTVEALSAADVDVAGVLLVV